MNLEVFDFVPEVRHILRCKGFICIAGKCIRIVVDGRDRRGLYVRSRTDTGSSISITGGPFNFSSFVNRSVYTQPQPSQRQNEKASNTKKINTTGSNQPFVQRRGRAYPKEYRSALTIAYQRNRRKTRPPDGVNVVVLCRTRC